MSLTFPIFNAELRTESEERFRLLIDNLGEGVGYVDPNEIFTFSNPASDSIFGVGPGELVGRSLLDFLVTEAQPIIQNQNALRRANVASRYEHEIVRPDGQRRSLEVTATPQFDHDGRFLGTCGVFWDITDRKKIEQELQASEERNRMLARTLECAGECISITDTEDRLLYVNDAFLKTYGYPRHELIGQHIGILRSPRTSADIQGEVLPATMSGQWVGELWNRTKEGREFLISLATSVVYDKDGGKIALVGMARDITDRKRAEDALRQSEERYRALFDRSLDCVFLTDFEGHFLDANQAALDLLGYRHEDITKVTFDSLLSEDQVLGALRTAGEILTTGCQQNPTEYRLRRKDGGHAFVETQGSLIYRDGTPFAIQGIARDITERKQAEDALRESEALLLETGEIAKVGGWKLDLGTNKLTWSHEVRRIHEVDDAFTPTVEKAIGFYAPECRALIQQAVARAIELGEPFSLELEIVTAKNKRLWVQAMGRNQRRNDGTDVLSGTFQDISERKRAEEEKDHLQLLLTQAQKMESVGRLAGGVAHDFNNLLTVINGYSQVLLAKLSANDPMADGLAEIHKAGERAAGLTRQLLAFSRKQVLEPRRLDVNRVVEDMRPMLQRLVGEDVEVRVALHAERGTIHADPHQLEQVVMNLVVNARDAMPGVGKLLVETAIVERDESYARAHPEARAGRYVMLAVSDTGTGMDEATKNRIFEPFFTTKGVGQGTGLGLSMVQGVVAQSSGYIEVYSEKGRGTTFKIYLPLTAEATDEATSPVEVPDLGGKETVLVVEDQAEVRKFAAAVLKSHGYRVIPAESASDALLFCEQERIDLVLTDVVMPKVSGRELADRLETLQPDVKVLFMSGYTDNVIAHHGILEKGAKFIQKPFSPEELAGKVRAVLGPPAPAPAARILVVDDEAGVRGFLRKVLEQGGHEVIEAVEGKQALQQVRAGHVDLVITDLIMPGQEGLETIQALRREAPGVGIVAISGAFGGQFLKTAQMMGAAAVLTKPVNAEVLLARVTEVLRLRR